MSKDKRDTQTLDMFDDLEQLHDQYLTDLMERLKDRDTIRVPDTIQTDEEFVQWVRGYN